MFDTINDLRPETYFLGSISQFHSDLEVTKVSHTMSHTEWVKGKSLSQS